MPKPQTLHAAIIVLFVSVSVFFAYQHWQSSDSLAERGDVLARMPADANALVFVDLSQLRTSPFLAQLLSWAPQTTPDSDYAQFVQATGFNYERDLDRLALAINREAQMLSGFAIADGRFDRKKIESYGTQFGSLKTADGKALYAVPMSGSTRKAFFTFLREGRLAWANDSSYFQRPSSLASSAEWREHFSRLSGSPLFVILRQDSGTASALAQAPGGLRSPELATLLGQLPWISISGKPEGNLLRVVVDGECYVEGTTRQLKAVLGGIVILAQAGLNDSKMRKQLDPQLREGYLDLLQSVNIEQLDRGSSKSVRLVFDVTPKLLQGAHSASSAADPQPHSKSH
jgi:hypothetical protein